MTEVESLYAELKNEVLQIQSDVDKIAAGQKAAAVRVRKAMLRTKDLSQKIRKAALSSGKEGGSDGDQQQA